MTLHENDIDRQGLYAAVWEKAADRNSVAFIQNYQKHIADINNSPEIARIWIAYCAKYSYAQGIKLGDILSVIEKVLTIE